MLFTGAIGETEPDPRLVPPFEHLDRSPSLWAYQARDWLTIQYSAYPEEAKPGLLRRFRSQDEHIGAHFELVCFGILRALGVPTEVLDIDNTVRAPDFRLGNVYWECTAVAPTNSSLNRSGIERDIVQALKQITNVPFAITVRWDGRMGSTPNLTAVRQKVDKWLRGPQPSDESLPALRIEQAGGTMVLEAERLPAPSPQLPVNEWRDLPLDEATPLRRAIERKRQRYQGRYGPLIVAVATNGVTDNPRHEIDALFGRYGLWGTEDHPKNSGISAVVFVRRFELAFGSWSTVRMYRRPHDPSTLPPGLDALPRTELEDSEFVERTGLTASEIWAAAGH